MLRHPPSVTLAQPARCRRGLRAMPKVLPVGAMDFRGARQRDDLSYVDKSAYIGRVLRSGAFALVHCRPRRFGKTLNLTMLREWLHKPARPEPGLDPFRGMSALHSDLAVADREKHAVLYLSLKVCKASTWAVNLQGVRDELQKAWVDLRIPAERIPTWFAPQCHDIEMATLPDDKLPFALGAMVRALHEIHGAPVWLLIDEYDAPVQTAWQHGFDREAVEFLRPFLGGALKDAKVVQKAVLTGILRVAKEGIFSELNGVVIDTVLDEEFATDFGFTEPEVMGLVGDDEHLMAQLRGWYNGYAFAANAMYNPWSVANALREPHRPMDTHWMASAGTELIARVATSFAQDSATDLEKLLTGETLRTEVIKGVVMPDIDRSPQMLLNVMLHTGYVTGAMPAEREDPDDDRLFVDVRLPNREVRAGTRQILENLLQRFEGVDQGGEKLLAALLRGDAEIAQAAFEKIIATMLSYHDLADKTPERVYHLFVLGLLARAPKGYTVRSNREYGDGRPDVVIEAGPAEQPSALLEFKAGRSARAACERAASQIVQRRYAEGLRGAPVYAWAIGFSGKAVVVRLVS